MVTEPHRHGESSLPQPFYPDRCRGRLAPGRNLDQALDAISLLDQTEHFEPIDHPSESGEIGVEMRLRRQGNEELTTTRVRTRQGHTDNPCLERLPIHLVPDREPGAAPAIPSGVSSLDHEIGHDAVKLEPVVEPLVDQLQEVQTGQRSGRAVEL